MNLFKHLMQIFTAPSKKELRVLEALADRDLYGLDFVNAKIAGHGSIYVLLARMEDRGLIEGREEEYVGAPPHHLPRRIYRITDAGRAVIFPVAKKV